jgi:hypothetical protein
MITKLIYIEVTCLNSLIFILIGHNVSAYNVGEEQGENSKYLHEAKSTIFRLNFQQSSNRRFGALGLKNGVFTPEMWSRWLYAHCSILFLFNYKKRPFKFNILYF